MQEIPAVTQDSLVLNLCQMSTIHQRIKSFREQLSLSMEQLAERVGVSWQTVQQWENGKTAPKRARLEAVAAALGTTAEQLLLGSMPAAGAPEKNKNKSSNWPFPSISEERIRALPPSQLKQLEGALILALGHIDQGLEVVRATSGKQAPPKVGAVYVPSPDEEDPFPIAPVELAPWEGGKPVDDRGHAPPPRLNLDRTVVANVGPGEPQAANERFEKVPELGDVRLAAGEGIENHTEEQTGFVQFRRSFLRSVGADAGRGRVVYAKGDSMEPIIRDGAALLVVPDLGLTLADVAAGGIYAINYDGKMLVKTVAKDRLTGRWVARSFNARHPDIPLEGEASVRVLGRVVWAGSAL
ncbi:XRE family transcriptional regulator [Bordetella trematum]|uniref:XRE family transcriptional regulator n=1 Tax=Bordetella trematum TaxID=123899 RepID=UPI003989637F